MFYLDGHVRAYQGTHKVAKTHTARLRFPGPRDRGDLGRTHSRRVADTTVDLPTSNDEDTFTMRQVSLQVANTKTGRDKHGQDTTRQIHILTTRTDLAAGQVIYRMGSRWRQENYFRYARMHFDLDSHDAYATTSDDPTPMVPNPAKKKAHQQVLDIQTKLITHAIRMAAFNTITALARAVRVHTGYARANDEAHNLIRQALTVSGDIDPHDGVLTVRLDPLPTQRATTAIPELCEHLTATETRYPGTDLVLRYEVKNRP